jgi:hypothetical protein
MVPVRRRPGELRPGFHRADHNEPIGVAHGHRTEEVVADEREDRRVDADTEPQRRDGHRGPPRSAQQRANGEGDVLTQPLEERGARHRSLLFTVDDETLLARPLDAPKSVEGSASRLGLAHPAGDVLTDARLDVKPQLVLDVGLRSRPPEAEIPAPRGGAHAGLGTVSSTLNTAATKRDQSADSARSCFLPSVVIV